MVRFVLTLMVALGFAVATVPTCIAAQDFVTAGGRTVRLPAIEGLDCTRMRDVLDAIDATGYRDTMPEPDDPADMPLMRYEHRLSEHYYGRCLKGRAETMQSNDAFVHGYRP